MVSGSKRISAIGSELFLKVRWTQLSFQVLFDVKYCFIEMMIHGREKTSCVFTHLEADIQRCSIKKAFLQISQNTQKKTCVRLRPAILLKKRESDMFSCGFCEMFQSKFFIEHLRWLLLPISALHLYRIQSFDLQQKSNY